ncbi:acetylornithine deacetylase [Paraburkholderia xenovorans LB400]|uniref:Acetylornithine deacetylase n=1 Tax=Paraburkholderia xenovorans (strain LB400) TaxID=266265 RepID=Q13FH0_PARXL|nr:acetylornithine deacetylase [Paraburkholderia xenovorans]ABE37169.1 acetylornithine deacetylase [Paraburkholderia xenovorans LB400]AIP34206.1 acetylornithine deacetylase [Paraburkholderia xenovorans LB400]
MTSRTRTQEGQQTIGLPWIEDLVSINTVSRNPNLELIELVRDRLLRQGIKSILTRDKRDGWSNLFATIPSHDGRDNGGVVLSGHTDVVPVDGQHWTSDPFRPVVRDGRLYGRGTCDMKGFIGTVLALVPEMLSAKLKRPVHIALSFDEEVGCLGVPLLIADMRERGINPEACIVGEPTSMQPVVGHKGINTFRCCVRGVAAHSSLTPNGVNAIEYAARLICHIRDVADRFRRTGPFDDAYDVPFSTAQTSTINGGNAINTVPAQCDFELEFRNLMLMEPIAIFREIEEYVRLSLLPEMQAQNSAASIEFMPIASSPGLEAAEEAAITQLVRALTGGQKKRKVAYGTEAGLFSQAGIPSIVCGPGDIRQAHRADEYVSLEQLSACEAFLRKLIRSMESL